MKKIFLILCAIIGLISCSESDTEINNELLIGSFTEVTPVKGRVTLQFNTGNQLSQKIDESDSTSTFTIRLLNGEDLELSCNECDESEPTIVSYRVINNDRLEIGGFSPAKPNQTMIFERNE